MSGRLQAALEGGGEQRARAGVEPKRHLLVVVEAEHAALVSTRVDHAAEERLDCGCLQLMNGQTSANATKVPWRPGPVPCDRARTNKLIASLAVTGALAAAVTPALAASKTVRVSDDKFTAKTITVAKGTTVAWKWVGSDPEPGPECDADHISWPLAARRAPPDATKVPWCAGRSRCQRDNGPKGTGREVVHARLVCRVSRYLRLPVSILSLTATRAREGKP